VVARPLFSFHRIVVASPGYIARRGEPTSLDAVASHDAVVHLGAANAPGTWELARGQKRQEVRVRGTFRCNNVYALRDAALAGLGLALLPDWLVESDIAAGTLRRVLPQVRSTAVSISALFRAEARGAPRIRAFVEHVARANGG
jgi:DNA-binding transcriptional LysR family regulator